MSFVTSDKILNLSLSIFFSLVRWEQYSKYPPGSVVVRSGQESGCVALSESLLLVVIQVTIINK